jgi:hypothetical protein
MQAARNHEVKHQPELPLEPYAQAFADAAHLGHPPALRAGDGRLYRTQQKR